MEFPSLGGVRGGQDGETVILFLLACATACSVPIIVDNSILYIGFLWRLNVCFDGEIAKELTKR